MLLSLKKNLVIEQTEGGLPVGNLQFPKVDFGLLLNVEGIDILADSFDVAFFVVRKSDLRIIRKVNGSVPIKKSGRPSDELANKKELDDYKAQKKKLKEDIEALKKELSAKRESMQLLRQELQDKRKQQIDFSVELNTLLLIQDPSEQDKKRIDELNDAIALLTNEINILEKNVTSSLKEIDIVAENTQNKITELENLPEVLPVFVMIDKYDDVIGTYIENNKLTTAGLEWVKTLPLLGKTASDWIE